MFIKHCIIQDELHLHVGVLLCTVSYKNLEKSRVECTEEERRGPSFDGLISQPAGNIVENASK